jgi:predicted aspartyl protease
MPRPAERFAVNVVGDDDYVGPSPRSLRLSPVTLAVLAAILGTGIGGVLPTAWNLKAPASPGSGTAVAGRLAAIEPAAGPSSALVVNRAADQKFYAPVLLDEIAVTMRLDPDAPASALTLDDARRLSGPGAAGNEVHVARMRLGGIAVGPLALPVANADLGASVLGADLLADLGTIWIDGPRLTLAPH